MPISTNRGRPNLDYVRHAVEAGALVHYQGGWSREVLVDALLGYVHTVNVCNNNFAELLTEKELVAYSAGDDQEPYRVRPSRLRFAHTSPLYVTVGGRSVAVRESIEEALRMLARFEAFAHERASPEYRPSIQDAVEQARRRLQERLRKL